MGKKKEPKESKKKKSDERKEETEKPTGCFPFGAKSKSKDKVKSIEGPTEADMSNVERTEDVPEARNTDDEEDEGDSFGSLRRNPPIFSTSNTAIHNYSKVISSMRESFKASDLHEAFPTITKPVPMSRKEKPGLHPKFRKEEYNMNHFNRGRAIIFLHDRFTNPEVDIGPGPATDAGNLPAALVKLGFKQQDIRIHRNLKLEQLENVVEHLIKEDHSNNDCIMLFMLTSTQGENCLQTADTEYRISYLWKSFVSCKTLAGKPKLFFLQACPMESDKNNRSSLIPPLVHFNIPMLTDFHLVFTTQPGIYSEEGLDENCRFIPALCDEIEEMDISKDDLQALINRVVYRVTLKQTQQELNIRRQCPVVTSTLLHKVYFRQKNSREANF